MGRVGLWWEHKVGDGQLCCFSMHDAAATGLSLSIDGIDRFQNKDIRFFLMVLIKICPQMSEELPQ